VTSFGGESEAAADRCDRTGAAHAAEAKHAEHAPALEARLRTHNQKMTVAAMHMALMKVCAHRS